MTGKHWKQWLDEGFIIRWIFSWFFATLQWSQWEALLLYQQPLPDSYSIFGGYLALIYVCTQKSHSLWEEGCLMQFYPLIASINEGYKNHSSNPLLYINTMILSHWSLKALKISWHEIWNYHKIQYYCLCFVCLAA